MNGCIYRTKDGECNLYSEGGKYYAFCVGDEPCEGRKLSIADRIRAMTDEELADYWSEQCCHETMKIKLDPGAKMPERAHPDDAGLDLFAIKGKVIYKGQSETFDTGVHIALLPNTYGKIESKSGLNVKHGVVSCGGVIDVGYTGSIRVKLYNFGDCDYHIMDGDKIAQLIIQPCLAPELELVDELEDTDRGAGGFGSTGR